MAKTYDCLDTKAALDSLFGDYAGGLRVQRQMGIATRDSAYTARAQFITGLARAIDNLEKGKVAETGGIGIRQLRTMFDIVCEADVTKPDAIRQWYGAFTSITGETFDESVFKGMR